MQAAHAGVLQYSTSLLHNTSNTALSDKGQQVGWQTRTAFPLLLLKVGD